MSTCRHAATSGSAVPLQSQLDEILRRSELPPRSRDILLRVQHSLNSNDSSDSCVTIRECGARLWNLAAGGCAAQMQPTEQSTTSIADFALKCARTQTQQTSGLCR